MAQPPPTFRPESGVLYVDESGQMRAPFPGAPPEFPLLGGLLIPNNARESTALRTLVARIQERLASLKGPGAHFKEARHDPTALDWIAGDVHDRWCLAHPAVEVQGAEDFAGVVEAMPSLIEQTRRNLRGERKYDLRLDFLSRRWAMRGPLYRIYLVVLFHLLRETARWFRSNGIVPRLSLVLDEKLRPEDEDLLTFWLRLALMTEFPEVYAHRLGSVLGVDPCPEFSCRVSTDDAEDGLKIADVIAYAKRRVLLGTDDHGVYSRFLASCTA